MTHQEKINFITEKAHEANPSILDLVFGCRLHHPGYHIAIITDFRGTGDGSTQKYFTNLNHVFYDNNVKQGFILRNSFESPNEWWQILGREIRLADVLLAIKQKDKNLEAQFEKDHKGMPPIKYNFFYQFMMAITKHDMGGGEFWNLLKDSLTEQPPETVDFIYQLLQ